MNNNPLNILVAGGAGYIGSVVTAHLIERGHRVTVLDNLSKGHLKAVHPSAEFVKGDISDIDAVRRSTAAGIDVALHFAAYIEVGESVGNPSLYYDNNVVKAKCFIDNLRTCGISRFVFSSTAAVYGEPENVPITETAPLEPVNPYGRSKLMVERILDDYNHAYNFTSTVLRYFNAGGAFGVYGEDHNPESHLIPRILNAVLAGDTVNVYGDDYNTHDGSCIRDYIHVSDLADAHIAAAQYLVNGGSSDCFNLGTGSGFTVFEVLRTVEKVTGHQVAYQITPRREGDTAALVASHDKATRILDWGKTLRPLEEIVESAWKWKSNHPLGYGE